MGKRHEPALTLLVGVAKRHFVRWTAAVAVLMACPRRAEAETVLRIVMNSDLKIPRSDLDTAFVIRDHGYMIYDTLFATDADARSDRRWSTGPSCPGQLTYRFTLRDGLEWQDGQPVTAEDCVASIRRWAARDVVGQKLMTFVEAVAATGREHDRDKAQEPNRGSCWPALGSQIPRAVHDAQARRRDRPLHPDHGYTGSGPFIFERDQWRPGHMAVYVRNPHYKPRPEPVSRLAGGKVAKGRPHRMARRRRSPAGHQRAADRRDRLSRGAPFDLHALLAADRNVELLTLSPVGSQNIFRLNHLHKPFDNPTVRRALWYASTRRISSRP